MTANNANNTDINVLDLSNMSEDALKELVQQLHRDKKRLMDEGAKSGKLTIKLGEKPGVISVYGLGRFPVSLYEETWRKLFEAQGDILAFIEKAREEGKLPTEAEVAAAKEAAKKAAAEKKAAEQAQAQGQPKAA